MFFGSCNDTKFLQDRTGNRRFWPILGVRFDAEALLRDRDHLWAEAAQAEAAGESIRLPKELWSVAETVQSESLEEEPWIEALAIALGNFEGKLRSADVWTILDVDPKNRKSVDDNRMGAAMRELSWERAKRRFGGDPEWSYAKGRSGEQVNVWRNRERRLLYVHQGCKFRRIVEGQAEERELDRPVTLQDLELDGGAGNWGHVAVSTGSGSLFNS